MKDLIIINVLFWGYIWNIWCFHFFPRTNFIYDISDLTNLQMDSLIEEAEDGNINKVAGMLSGIKDEEVK